MGSDLADQLGEGPELLVLSAYLLGRLLSHRY